MMSSLSTYHTTINPFLMEMVVENIFEHLTHQDLRNCIEVSKAWKQLALREFMIRNQPLKVPNHEGIKTVIALIHIDKKRRARYSRIGFRNVRLMCEHVKNLFSHTGDFLTTVILDNCIAEPKDFREILCNLPNLRDLGIISISSYWGKIKPFQLFPIHNENSEGILVFPMLRRLQYQSICYIMDPMCKETDTSATITYLSDALRTFPNLEEVAVLDLAVENSKQFQSLKPYSIKKLSIKVSVFSDGLSNQILEMLYNMKLSLEHFDIKINPAPQADLPFGLNPLDVNTKLLRKFIESQASTLESLEIFQVNELRMAIPNPSFCPFPLCLPNLKILEINRGFVRNFAHVINNLPNLTEARFWFPKETSWAPVLPNTLKQHGNLKTLRIQHIDEKSLMKLLECFPNITTLQITQWNMEVIQALKKFVEFEEKVLQDFEKACEDCLAKTVPERPEQISFWNQNSIKGLSKPKTSTLPGLKRIFLRKCRHAYFYFRVDNDWPFNEKMHLIPSEIYALNTFERPAGTAFQSQTWMNDPEPGSDDLEYFSTGLAGLIQDM